MSGNTVSLSAALPIVFAATAAAQAVSTATATMPLVVTSSTNGSQTLPIGPLPATGASLVTTGQSAVWARIQVTPWPAASLPAGGTGWGVSGLVNVAIGFPGGSATASLSGRVQLDLSSPQPVSGLLYLFPSFAHAPQFQSFSGDLTLDVDCDGVADYAASVYDQRNVQLPVTLDAVGTSLCVDLALTGSWSYFGPNSVQGQADAAWNIVFLPNTYGLENRWTGCAPIAFYRDRNAGFRVNVWSGPSGVPAPPIAVGFFLVGLGEQVAPVPLPPFCPVLVAGPVAVSPSVQWSTEIGIFLPDVPIPSGLHFYCQAFWLNTQGGLVTSDSIRTM